MPEENIHAISQEEREKVIAPSEKWSDEYAAKIALADFQKMENYRSMNHDWRFRNADELYAAWTGTKYWEGTRVPRSSLGIYVCFEQIESLLPNIVKAIFSSYPPFRLLVRSTLAPDLLKVGVAPDVLPILEKVVENFKILAASLIRSWASLRASKSGRLDRCVTLHGNSPSHPEPHHVPQRGGSLSQKHLQPQKPRLALTAYALQVVVVSFARNGSSAFSSPMRRGTIPTPEPYMREWGMGLRRSTLGSGVSLMQPCQVCIVSLDDSEDCCYFPFVRSVVRSWFLSFSGV